jgi:hypothetical protein
MMGRCIMTMGDMEMARDTPGRTQDSIRTRGVHAASVAILEIIVVDHYTIPIGFGFQDASYKVNPVLELAVSTFSLFISFDTLDEISQIVPTPLIPPGAPGGEPVLAALVVPRTHLDSCGPNGFGLPRSLI